MQPSHITPPQPPHTDAPPLPRSTNVSEFDTFQSRLLAILNGDFHSLAAAGPADTNASNLQSLADSLTGDESSKKALDELHTLYQQKHIMQRAHHLRYVWGWGGIVMCWWVGVGVQETTRTPPCNTPHPLLHLITSPHHTTSPHHQHRVNAINEEYQQYMERVRAQAQGAIDKANQQYEHAIGVLNANIDTYVHFLQQHQVVAPEVCGEGGVGRAHSRAHCMHTILPTMHTHTLLISTTTTTTVTFLSPIPHRLLTETPPRLMPLSHKMLQVLMVQPHHHHPMPLMPMLHHKAINQSLHQTHSNRRCSSATPTSPPISPSHG